VSGDADCTRVADADYGATSKSEKRVGTKRFGPFSYLLTGQARSKPPVSHLTAAERGLC
jgi:hypothetical protein